MSSGGVLAGRVALSVMRPITRSPMVPGKICIVGNEFLVF